MRALCVVPRVRRVSVRFHMRSHSWQAALGSSSSVSSASACGVESSCALSTKPKCRDLACLRLSLRIVMLAAFIAAATVASSQGGRCGSQINLMCGFIPTTPSVRARSVSACRIERIRHRLCARCNKPEIPWTHLRSVVTANRDTRYSHRHGCGCQFPIRAALDGNRPELLVLVS